jgi:hypothetical protein
MFINVFLCNYSPIIRKVLITPRDISITQLKKEGATWDYSGKRRSQRKI